MPNRWYMPAAEKLTNTPELTVSELSSALKRTVEDTFGHVRVRGEISGFRGPHSSGHCYFALKDESAKIEAVIWKFVHAPDALQAAGRARGHRHRQADDLSRIRRNTRSSSNRWSPPASAR